MSLASESAYQSAYNAHYKRKNLEEAYQLYLSVINDYPNTNEANYAKQQIKNLSAKLDLDSVNLSSNLQQIKNAMDDQTAKVAAEKTRVEEEKRIAQEKKDEQRRITQHLKEIMMMSTCPSFEGYRIIKHHGLVFGECIFKASFQKIAEATVADMMDLFSSGNQGLSGSTEIIDDARNYAIERMVNKAANMGANAIVGIDAESSFGGGLVHTTIYGTAVTVEPV